MPAAGSASAAAVQPDGRIVVAGETPSADFFVARFDAAGAVDATFAPAVRSRHRSSVMTNRPRSPSRRAAPT
jgi:Domain of unknown function (DUF5122) beta-propeller